MEVFLDNSAASLLVEVFAHYTNLVIRKKVNLIKLSPAAQQHIQSGTLSIPAIPSLITPESIITNPISICVYFSNLSFTSDIMIGKKNDTEFLSIFDQCSRLHKNQDAILAHFNQDLEQKVFIVGHHITLGDLILFAFTYPIVTCFSDATKWKFNNLFRWFNTIQNLEGIKEFIEKTNRSFSSYPEPLLEVTEAKGGKKK